MSSIHPHRDSSPAQLERLNAPRRKSRNAFDAIKTIVCCGDSNRSRRTPRSDMPLRESVAEVINREREVNEHHELATSIAIDAFRELKNIHSLSAEEIRQKNRHFDVRYEASITDKGNGVYEVDVSRRRTADHLPRRAIVYRNSIDLNQKEIIGGYNFPAQGDGRPRTHSDRMVSRMSLSDIKYQALRYVIDDINSKNPESSPLNIEDFQPKKLVGHEVEESGMYAEVSKVLTDRHTNKLTIHRGSEEFDAIMMTPPGKSAIFLAENYFSGRQITHLEIERGIKNKQIALVEYHLTPANSVRPSIPRGRREILLE